MANIRPFDLPPAPSVPSSAAFVIDTGAVVQKATAEQIVDSAVPLATQAEAETGSGNDTRMSPLRVQQAINAQALSPDFLSGPDGAEKVGLEQGGTVQEAISWVTPQMFGVNIGVAGVDATAALKAMLKTGGKMEVPEGDYLIAAAGPDAGGVEATITKSIHVRCHPRARFYTNGLDNDMIRISVPADGTGLPTDLIDVLWEGGVFDQRAQKRSTSVPFAAEFPVIAPVEQGASATTSGLSIRGNYAVGGVPFHGINSARVTGIKVLAGTHWELAGGDEGIFIGGCVSQTVDNSSFTGSRDLAVYFSGDDVNGTLRCKSTSFGNTYTNCFGCVAQKRSGGDVSFTGETFINSPRPAAIEHIVGPGTDRVVITGNTYVNCSNFARLTYCTGYELAGNKATSHGALMSDGTSAVGNAVTNNVGFAGVWLRGCSRGIVVDNDIASVEAVYATAYASTSQLLLLEDYNPGSGAVGVTDTTLMRNTSDGMRRMGSDTANCAGNRLIENYAVNAVVPNFPVLGSNTTEIRLLADRTPSYRQPLRFADGTAADPIISREGQVSTGIFFDTNKVGMSGGGVERFAVNNAGVGFNGATPAARSVYGAPTGTATRTTFVTSTVTLEQLAERVKAIIDDLRVLGVMG